MQMKMMKKLFSAALLAGAAIGAMAGTANAEGTFTGNVGLTTDYVFRGISQTNGNPAIQGGLDYVNGAFYAGTWMSNTDFGPFGGNTELDLYAGWTPTVGPVALNLGVLGYFYPGAHDDAAEFNYYELKGTATITPFTGFSLTGSAYYSPDFFGETGNALYLEIAGAYTVSDKISISGAFGNQKIDDVNGPAAGGTDGDYNTWNLGLTYTIGNGLSVDGRYIDTDIDPSDDIATFATTDETQYDSAFVLSIKKAL